MILIVGALSEELEIGLNLCDSKMRLKLPGIRAWQGVRAQCRLWLLKAGPGPLRSEKSLRTFLNSTTPDRILLIGYAGALDPGLRAGDLVVVERASLLEGYQNLDDARLNGTWLLADNHEIHRRGNDSGLGLRTGNTLTSSRIIGERRQKECLYQKYEATIIDMETAALARAAAEAAVPMSCVRAVCDEARDEFLAPFSFDASAPMVSRAVRVLRAGNWGHRYTECRARTAVAQPRLRDFLVWYLDSSFGAS